MPTPPNMLRARTRGITRLSWSMTKVRKLELTGTRHDLQMFGVRLTDRDYAAARNLRVQQHNDSFESRAASFKRLLGACSSKSKESKQGIKALELSRVNILRLHRPQNGADEQRHRSGHAPQNKEREPPGGIVTAPNQKGKHGGCNDRGAHKRSESVQGPSDPPPSTRGTSSTQDASFEPEPLGAGQRLGTVRAQAPAVPASV